MKKKEIYIYVIILIAVSIAIYYPVTDYPFMKSWDDQWQVLNFYTTNGLSMNSIISIFSTFYNGQYSPLNQLYYTAIFHYFGFNASVFHLFSLLWHVGYTILIFCFIHKLLNEYHRKPAHANMLIALGVSISVAIHPVNAEVVSWLSASKVLLCSFFYMASLLCYLCYIKNERTILYIGSLFFFLCAFFCKEQAVTLPLCLLLIDWFVRRNMHSKMIIIEKIPFFTMTLCMLAVTFASYQETFIDVVTDYNNYPLFQRIIFCGYAICEYIQKTLLPMNLQYIYPYPMNVGDSLPVRFYFYLLIVPALGYIIYMCRNQKIIIFGILFFLIQLSLFLHIIPLPRFTITADRYLYIASIGLLFMLSYYFHYAVWLYCAKWKYICIPTLIILLGIIGCYTRHCSQKWESEKSLKYEIKQILEERKKFYNY
jgi:hypothetical protein